MESSGLSFALARNQGSGKFKPGLQESWTTMGCGESGLGPNANKSRFVISNLKSPSILSHESKAYKFLEKFWRQMMRAQDTRNLSRVTLLMGGLILDIMHSEADTSTSSRWSHQVSI
jgi:hypothetical protein